MVRDHYVPFDWKGLGCCVLTSIVSRFLHYCRAAAHIAQLSGTILVGECTFCGATRGAQCITLLIVLQPMNHASYYRRVDMEQLLSDF